MGLDKRCDCTVTFESALANQGARLTAAALSLGRRIAFDPVSALARETPMRLFPPSQLSPNQHCRLMEAADGWIAVNLARPEDREALPAWINCDATNAPIETLWNVISNAVRTSPTATLIAQAVLLGMPVAKVSPPSTLAGQLSPKLWDRPRAPGANRTALDLSALWAGPYCGALLAEAGFVVTKIESPVRPDPTANDVRLNGRKRHHSLDLADPSLTAMIIDTDVLITSARPHALARLSLTEERLFALNPSLLWIAITAYGWSGEAALRVGFGDDCAAAAGLLGLNAGKPVFLGDALADPITGIVAATETLEAVVNGKAGLVDVALAPTAAAFAQRAGITG
jgi:CoA-transferase family III